MPFKSTEMNVLHNFIYMKFKTQSNDLMGTNIRRVVTLWGEWLGQGRKRVLECSISWSKWWFHRCFHFAKLLWVLNLWSMHFSVPMLFFQKKKNSLLKSEALTSPSLREALIRFRLGGLSRHGLLYPSTSTLRTALLGTFTGKQQGCKAPQGSGRPYMSWMNSLAEPTCVNIPHLTILRKYLGRP